MSEQVISQLRRANEPGARATPGFGELLRWHRTRRGKTQRQLADLSTVSVRAIRDLELGRAHLPRRDTVHLIADGLRLAGRERAHFEEAAGGSGQEMKLAFDTGPVAPPAPLDTVVGREAEVSMLSDLLGTGSLRLVTVTGLPGVGKSRIALETAGLLHREHRLPVLWISAPDQSAASSDACSGPVSALVALALGRPAMAAARTALAELCELLGDRLTLLVLDGYEQAGVDADALAGLLRHCGRLRVLITARRPFQLPGERQFPLAPLAVPPRRADRDLTELAEVDSVKLLTRCIGQPTFRLSDGNCAAVAELCRLLDGIPASLQVAASWFMVYSPEALVEHLRNDPFAFIGRDQSDSLSSVLGAQADDERALLARLCTVEGAWSITDAARLSGLAPTDCAWLVRRLLMRGVLRASSESKPGGFAVLELIKLLHSGQPVGVPYLHDEASA